MSGEQTAAATQFSAHMNGLQSFDEDTLFCHALQFLKTKSKF